MNRGGDFWNLQPNAGSKRPSPSPGADDRENKKHRTEPHLDAAERVAVNNDWPQEFEDTIMLSEDLPSDDWNVFDYFNGDLPSESDIRLDNGFGNHLDGSLSIEPADASFHGMHGVDHALANDTHSWTPHINHQESTLSLQMSEQLDQSPQELPLGHHAWTRNLAYQVVEDPQSLSNQKDTGEDNVSDMNPGDQPTFEAPEPNQMIMDTSPQQLLIEPTKQISNDSNICYGVVIATPTSSIEQELRPYSVPVNLKSFGSIFLLHDPSSDRNAGILNNSHLINILRQFSLELDATLLVSGTKESKAMSKPATKKSVLARLIPEHSLRIAIYGPRGDKDKIGGLLSDAGFFLQHPFADEIKPGIIYDNPHYLCRPGAGMPELKYLSPDDMGDDSPHNMLGDGLGESRWLRMFDNAAADESAATVVRAHISPRLCSPLMSHQTTALTMMQEKERGYVEEPIFSPLWKQMLQSLSLTIRYRHTVTRSLENRPAPPMGGILADDMGLGKTLSMLALICSSLDYEETLVHGNQNSRYQGTLIVAPMSTLYGWETQISEHIHEGQMRRVIYHGPGRESLANRFEDYDVVITTYETLRAECGSPEKSSPLLSWKWLRVVLDEAHHIRNRAKQAFRSVCALNCRYRWCLTGTPIHNSLDDYGALLSFIRVSPFEQKAKFMSWIVKPLETNDEISIDRLQRLIRTTCLRRTKQKCLSHNDLSLPERSEIVHKVRLHEADQALYNDFKELAKERAAGLGKQSRETTSRKNKEENILSLINWLRLICDHGAQLLPDEVVKMKSKNSASSFSILEAHRFHGGKCSSCEGELDIISGSDSDGLDSLCSNCLNSEGSNGYDTFSNTADKDGSSSPSKARYQPSAKVVALLETLKQQTVTGTNGKPQKSVVFSYWTKMLDLVGLALEKEQLAFQRIDGKTSLRGRQNAMQEFKDNPNCRVMLASLGSAAEGVNFTAASMVHLLEPHWNPTVEAQAVDRVYRIGQTQKVTVIRYIVPNSVETYVQSVQQQKLRIIDKSINMDDATEAREVEKRWESMRQMLE
ncbi:hypothetical protein PFICI_07919 [Pestalotiopsis fici W106-1]|uniref:Helicase ATP-binding domain-containing protein n=1 Tax=Pestalotiopsis fici (strain W106-1 / CGMCC3.15140) TaxID=1229662 RepID=W3X2U3_PESFW|nr:uncharacterized protein PFICI_07919 [Pestalotiopsis fici W106-1]ETS80390.1 hypothetical protein PFICI_07919 [Pestalotiopsis fici W106-1]